MNRFIILYCLDLLLLVVMLFLPTSIMTIHLLSIFGIVSLVLVIISACFYLSYNDTFLMLVLLVAINWAAFLKEYYVISKLRFAKSYSVVFANFLRKCHPAKGVYEFDYVYLDSIRTVNVGLDNYYKDSLNKSVLIVITPYAEILKNQVTDFEKRKFKYPVEYRNNLEYGNDSYDYCFIEPYTALNNFGLRCITKTIEKSDTILYYRNLNPSIDSVAHRLADTLQTAFNRALVGNSFAFLFHDGIYSKEQVFEEIPQAKEYYLKYCKDEDISSGNILRNH